MRLIAVSIIMGAALHAQTPSCLRSPNLGASLSATPSVTFDDATRRYRYQYTFLNNGTRDVAHFTYMLAATLR
ncbi:MAG TPA: hypothetical protein VFL57_02490 [Bryobacteraceae bacterium]|nr:hypothetical protein [Bryobacteraceae bacterium]